MSNDSQERAELAYWKAAISRLPTDEMRNAAWEFFLRRVAESPGTADTFSGMILIMQANGLYMLSVPALVHTDVIDPLKVETERFIKEFDERIQGSIRIAEAIHRKTESVEKSIQLLGQIGKQIESSIVNGWREVKLDSLIDELRGEFRLRLEQPLKKGCSELENQTRCLAEASKKAQEAINCFHQLNYGRVLLFLILWTALVAVVTHALTRWRVS